MSAEVWRNTKYSWCYSAEKAQTRSNEAKKKGRRKKLDVNLALKEYVYEKLCSEWSPEEITQRIQDIVSISERPREAEDRRVPGHWEGDMIMGKERKSAVGSLVERTTRLTLLVPLDAKDAFTVRSSFAKSFKQIPKKFKKTLTYDRGMEMAEHKLFTKETKINVYFADPYSPWQRGTNENTNGLIRQYFPKGTDFNTVPMASVREAEWRLNTRPRKALDFHTPLEKFYELITGQKVVLVT